MGKLVRDRISDLFGGPSRTLTPTEFRAALRSKLEEEVAEDLESGEVLELAACWKSCTRWRNWTA